MSPFQTKVDLAQPIKLDLPVQDTLALRLESAAFWLLCSLLVFAPLAFGGVEDWSILVVEWAASLVFLLLCVSNLISRQWAMLRNSAMVPIALFTCLIALQVAFSLTQYRHATLVEFLKVGAYGMAACVALQVLRGSDRLKHFVVAISIFGFAISVYAILQHFTSPDKLYWVRVPSQGGLIFGPYVNRNHFAGLMEMITPFAVVGILVPYQRREKRALMLFAAVLMSASLFLTASRSGIIAFTAEMVLMASFLLVRSKNRKAAASVGILGTLTIAMLLWLGTQPILERFSVFSDDIRVSINKDGLRMIAQHPIMGTGLGTFPYIYPQYRSFSTNLFVNEAHNDVLQLLIETGVPGFLIVVWFVVIAYRRGLEKAQSWNTHWKGAASLAAVVGMTGIAVHSLTDFNMQIPANALFFCVLCSLAAARERHKAVTIESSRRFRRPTEIAGTLEGVEDSGQ